MANLDTCIRLEKKFRLGDLVDVLTPAIEDIISAYLELNPPETIPPTSSDLPPTDPSDVPEEERNGGEAPVESNQPQSIILNFREGLFYSRFSFGVLPNETVPPPPSANIPFNIFAAVQASTSIALARPEEPEEPLELGSKALSALNSFKQGRSGSKVQRDEFLSVDPSQGDANPAFSYDAKTDPRPLPKSYIFPATAPVTGYEGYVPGLSTLASNLVDGQVSFNYLLVDYGYFYGYYAFLAQLGISDLGSNLVAIKPLFDDLQAAWIAGQAFTVPPNSLTLPPTIDAVVAAAIAGTPVPETLLNASQETIDARTAYVDASAAYKAVYDSFIDNSNYLISDKITFNFQPGSIDFYPQAINLVRSEPLLLSMIPSDVYLYFLNQGQGSTGIVTSFNTV
jgi:hypothetical protein